MPKAKSSRVDKGLPWLIAAAVATVVLWQVPFGGFVVYPFTILATWFHEMGHGLTAMVLGGRFEKLLLFPGGSGMAVHSGSLLLGDLGRALVAAGGPIGPPVAGALFILAGRRTGAARTGLIFLGLFLCFSALVWVRSPFGLLAVPLLGIGILLLAFKASAWTRGFAIQLLGVQACVSTYQQIGYLFTRQVVIGGQGMLTDTGQMADALFLPFWFWGALLTAASLVLLLASLKAAYR